VFVIRVRERQLNTGSLVLLVQLVSLVQLVELVQFVELVGRAGGRQKTGREVKGQRLRSVGLIGWIG
jgi:hypothetical protein